MNEHEKPDHWADLLSNLGVEIPPEEKATSAPEEVMAQPAAPAPEPAPLPRSTYQPPPREPQRSPKDWFRLANELGVEVPAEELLPEPAEPEPAVTAQLPEPVAVTQPARREEHFEPLQDEAGFADVDRWDSDVQTTEEREDKKLRRRRKRRRKTRRSEEVVLDADPSLREEELEQQGELTEIVEIFEEEEIEEFGPAETDESSEAAEELPQKRSKRRRRRRSSRKKTGKEEVASRGAEFAEPVASEPEDDLDTDDFDEDVDDEDVASVPEGRKRDRRMLHRGIPTWKDAVDVVISANLEARAKRPDRGSGARGRGGRNRSGRERPDRNG
jgi:hypothetical protein